MAVTLYRKKIIRIKNKVVIKNNVDDANQSQEETKPRTPPQEVSAKIKGRMYGRRTIN